MNKRYWVIPTSIVAINALAIAMRWNSLSELLPAHFDLEGNAAGSMSRHALLLYPLMGAVICLAAYIIARIKHTLKTGLTVLSSGICLILLSSTLVSLTQGKLPVFMLAEPVILLLTIIAFIIYSIRMRKDKTNFTGSLLCISASVALLSGCANSYYCTVNSRGISPAEKTYYIEPRDPSMRHSFEFEEYATILKEHLDSSGYEEANIKTAALRIELGYGIGDAFPISSAGANTTAPNYGNYSVTYNIPIGADKGSTTHTYKIPLYVVIRAFETLTNKSVWAVVVEDELDRETQMQTVMPWLLLAAKDYFGRSSNGEQSPRIRNTSKNREKYQLVWPY